MMGRCDKCKHWSLYHMGPDDDFHPDDYEGECKRYPPTIYKDHGDEHQHYSDNFMFPTTVAYECCGEFAPSNVRAKATAAGGSPLSEQLGVRFRSEKKEARVGHKVKMLIEVDCEDCAFSLDDPASVEWFAQEVLMNQTEDGALYLHSNEVGDTVGRVRVLVVHDWPPKNTPNVL